MATSALSESSLEYRRRAQANRVRRAFVTRILASGTATVEDTGAVPPLFVTDGIIRLAGYSHPRGRPCRGHYDLIDRADALRWLADNPELPDPFGFQDALAEDDTPDLAEEDQDGDQYPPLPIHQNDETPAATTAGAAAGTL